MENSKLVAKAIDMMKYAHAPYSRFKVGAALLCEDGTVYCFDVKRDALVFNGELSDEFIKLNEDEPEIVDGFTLELWRTYE